MPRITATDPMRAASGLPTCLHRRHTLLAAGARSVSGTGTVLRTTAATSVVRPLLLFTR